MKPNCSKQKKHALTLLEVLVVLAMITVLAAMILPQMAAREREERRVSCLNNLKQIGLACRVWAGDNNDKYPMAVSVTNGGAMQLVATGNVVAVFQVMSNELSIPKVLICPQDRAHFAANNFGPDFTAKNISYFIGIVTNESNPRMILSGDDNLTVAGTPIPSGLSTLSTNSDLAWTSARHTMDNTRFGLPPQNQYHGNLGDIGYADGSADILDTPALQEALQQANTNTTRLAIP